MSRYFRNRPERNLSKAEIEEITSIYLADEISVRKIAVDFGVNHKSIRGLCRRLNLPKRTVGWRPASVMLRVNAAKNKPPATKVNWGYQKPVQMAPSQSPLERAKDVLRRKGYVVFEPWRFDTSAVKGIVHVDHLRLTAEQVIQRAGL